MLAVRPSRRQFRSLVVLLAVVVTGLLAPAAPARAEALGDVPRPPELAVPKDNMGPLTTTDRDFVIKVRLAGLWEIPAGRMAQQKGASARVKEIGREIANQHVELDALSRQAAASLRIGLPDEPNDDQQNWLREMQVSSGAEFDQIFVDRLRAAHGKIFPAIASVRAGTRNAAVRKLAQEANAFVLTHITLLESTGLVDYSDLPRPPAPEKADFEAAAAPGVNGHVLSAAQARQAAGGMNTSVILIVLAAALVAGVVSTMRLLRR